jgi:hypothetical protein
MAAEMYANREFVAAYERFRPVHDKVLADMQRVLARNLEFEANKFAKEQRKSLAAAKEYLQKMKVYAQQVIDQLDRIRQDLESKPLVRVHLRKGKSAGAVTTRAAEGTPPAPHVTASESLVDGGLAPPSVVTIGPLRYRRAPYVPPVVSALYSVRDKAKGERIIRVLGKSPDGTLVQVESLDNGKPSRHPIQLAVDSLARQAAKGWCSLLLPATSENEPAAATSQPTGAADSANVNMRLDIQNFGRCCADIARANIRSDTQLIKDR